MHAGFTNSKLKFPNSFFENSKHKIFTDISKRFWKPERTIDDESLHVHIQSSSGEASPTFGHANFSVFIDRIRINF